VETLAILILSSALLAAAGMAQLSSRRAARHRLARLAAGSPRQLPSQADRGVLAEEPGRWVRWLSQLGGAGRRETTRGALRERLVHAGYRRASAPAVFVGSRVVLALALPALLLIPSSLWGLEQWQVLAVLGCASALGFVGPSAWLDWRGKARQREVLLGLPDALDLMVVCVEAGLGINASLARIARELAPTHPLLSSEFELVTLEIRAGKSTTEALRGLARRTGITEVNALVSMLLQTERFGTSLSDTLRVHADGMRVRRMQRAEELAGRAPLKMMFPTVLIFVATLMVTIGPGFMQITAFFRDR
jgi:tight adherence protein C